MFVVLGGGTCGERKTGEEKEEQSLWRDRKGLRARTLVRIYIWRQDKIVRDGDVEKFCILYQSTQYLNSLWSDFAAWGIFCLLILVSCCLEYCVISLCFFFLTISCSFSLENCGNSLRPQLRTFVSLERIYFDFCKSPQILHRVLNRTTEF